MITVTDLFSRFITKSDQLLMKALLKERSCTVASLCHVKLINKRLGETWPYQARDTISVILWPLAHLPALTMRCLCCFCEQGFSISLFHYICEAEGLPSTQEGCGYCSEYRIQKQQQEETATREVTSTRNTRMITVLSC